MADVTTPVPGSAQWRKERPVFAGVLRYFPDALLEVAYCSYKGNEQHNPNTPLHWDRSKSTDEGDACVRHLMESGTVDTDGVRHAAKAAWRALALLQKEIEAERKRLQLQDCNDILASVMLPEIRSMLNDQSILMKYLDDDYRHEDIEGDPNYWGV